MIDYNDAMRQSVEYFGGDELAASVFLSKYALHDEEGNLLEATPEDMHRRIARELARIEHGKFKNPLSEEDIFGYLDRFKRIVPQGSPMYAIGNNHQYISCANCFVVRSPDDAYSDILRADEELVQISKRRGGVGLDLSNIRPNKSRTKNAARTSTGVVTFAARYSNSIREVGQDGRRGALMLTLSVHHPDVLDFATCKVDRTKVTGANISIRLTDEFLKAVENDAEYEQRFPVETNAKRIISRMVKARDVWRKIIETAHATAEPGLLFWDKIISESPADCYDEFRTTSCNPCLIKHALILTQQGTCFIKDIKPGDCIWSKEGWTTVIDKWSTGIQPVYRYCTTAGEFTGTELHNILSGGTPSAICSLDTMDVCSGPFTTEVVLDPAIIMDGFVMGDGSANKQGVFAIIGDNDQDLFDSEISSFIGARHGGQGSKWHKAITNIQTHELPHTHLRTIPYRYMQGDRNVVCSFLRGLYTANGSLCGGRITLKAASKNVIIGVQKMLSSVGIRSYYTTNKPSKVKFSNGEYLCKQSYDLNITTDRDKFFKTIGFIQKYKTDKLERILSTKHKADKPPKTTYDIKSVEYIGEEETYDIKVDNSTNTFWCDGIDVHNCAELPLSPGDACRLTLINLLTYVKYPFTDKAYFDFDAFYADAQVAQRLMDDINDFEIEAIGRILTKIDSDPEPEDIKRRERELWERVRKACYEGRRTGTGITALGDTLAALNIKYGSEASIDMTESIYRTLKLGCYRSSVDMAKELGAFKVWDREKEKDNPFLLRIKDEDPQLYEDMQKYGRRNISLLTTAPAGTVSVETQTTSGIEPVFMLSYTRRKKINPSDHAARVDFVDANGDRWQEYTVYHHGAKRWMELTGKDNVEESPYWGATANEIEWSKRVEMQARANKHVDHSISSTVNLPNDVSVEEVAKIYETAWKAGCKGITVYRQGCRDGVLVESQSKDKANSLTKTTAPKRPKMLSCDVYHTTSKGEKFVVAVGLMEGEPYEVLAAKTSLPHRGDTGLIERIKRGHYRLLDEKGDVWCNDFTVLCDDDQEALTRMTSTALRHGSDIRFIVEQLEKVQGSMQSFAKCLGRVLKKYIPDGTPVSGEHCQDCGETSLVRQSGCVMCANCGWSKCS